MVKALVTGGTGFVGSHIARLLAADGHQVRVVHRTTSRLTALEGVDYESIIGNLHDMDSLRVACQGVEWVFHVAAVADYWRADKTRMFEANVEGTRRVLEAARECNVKRIMFTSSAGALGIRTDGQPANETTDFNLQPDQFPYGYSKVLAEEVIQEAVAQGQDVVILNPAVVMGPGDLNMISGSFIIETRRLPILPYSSGGINVIDVRDVARYSMIVEKHGPNSANRRSTFARPCGTHMNGTGNTDISSNGMGSICAASAIQLISVPTADSPCTARSR
jgi:dihydroflavonol-4-reductase